MTEEMLQWIGEGVDKGYWPRCDEMASLIAEVRRLRDALKQVRDGTSTWAQAWQVAADVLASGE